MRRRLLLLVLVEPQAVPASAASAAVRAAGGRDGPTDVELVGSLAWREVGLRPATERLGDVRVKEAKGGVHLEVIAGGVRRQRGVHSPYLSREPLELEAVLGQQHVTRLLVLATHLRHLRRHRPQLSDQLCDGHDHPAARRRRVELPLDSIDHLVHHVLERHSAADQVAVLSEHPADDANEDVGQDRPVQHRVIGGRGEAAERHIRLVVFSGPLGNQAHQVVRHVRPHELAAELEDAVHRLDEPRVVRRVPLGELCDSLGEGCAEGVVRRLAEV
mmetsp:Transcript_10945/g.34747  ORF Transcript_10945/g.34747 Transcript_10945/m.34747 type:complete len:274 (-) Transcript_10945:1244-2065(-)